MKEKSSTQEDRRNFFPLWSISLHDMIKNKHINISFTNFDFINFDLSWLICCCFFCYVYKSNNTICSVTWTQLFWNTAWHQCNKYVDTLKCPFRIIISYHYHIISPQASLSHCQNEPSWVNSLRSHIYCGAEAAAGWFVWVSWVVSPGLIRGFFHRRGGRLGNSGLYSHWRAERLCRWYGTRILWVALHLLRDNDELLDIRQI